MHVRLACTAASKCKHMFSEAPLLQACFDCAFQCACRFASPCCYPVLANCCQCAQLLALQHAFCCESAMHTMCLKMPHCDYTHIFPTAVAPMPRSVHNCCAPVESTPAHHAVALCWRQCAQARILQRALCCCKPIKQCWSCAHTGCLAAARMLLLPTAPGAFLLWACQLNPSLPCCCPALLPVRASARPSACSLLLARHAVLALRAPPALLLLRLQKHPAASGLPAGQ